MLKRAIIGLIGLASLGFVGIEIWLTRSWAVGLACAAAVAALAGLLWALRRIWRAIERYERSVRSFNKSLATFKSMLKDVRRRAYLIEDMLEDQHPDQRKLEQRLARLTASSGIMASQIHELIDRMEASNTVKQAAQPKNS